MILYTAAQFAQLKREFAEWKRVHKDEAPDFHAVDQDGRYVYDLTLLNTSSNTKIRAVEGIVTVSPRVTQ